MTILLNKSKCLRVKKYALFFVKMFEISSNLVINSVDFCFDRCYNVLCESRYMSLHSLNIKKLYLDL